MKVQIHNFTNVYKNQDFYEFVEHLIFEESSLCGVKGYLSKEMEKYLREQISIQNIECNIHFLDSGNYHYLSYLYLEQVKEPFNLIVFDNHTDMNKSSIGELITCGSWIRESYNNNKFLNNIFMVGVSKKYIDECDLKSNNIYFLDSIMGIDKVLPVYLSIDKDVLSKEIFNSDWDSGNMTMEYLLSEIEHLLRYYEILGIDICGEPDIKQYKDIQKSNFVNREILKLILNFKNL